MLKNTYGFLAQINKLIVLYFIMKLYLTSAASKVMDKIDIESGKKVAFISTAANPYLDKWFVEKDRKALIKKELNVIDFDIMGKNSDELFEQLKDYDVIFVAGGNTFYLLDKMKSTGFDEVLVKLLEKGIIYVGSSAGSIVVCPDISYASSIDDSSKVPDLKDYSGLNFISSYILPHYKEKYNNIIEENKNFDFITLTDSELLIVDGSNVKKI